MRTFTMAAATVGIFAAHGALAAPTYARLTGMQTAFDSMPAGERDKLVLLLRATHKNAVDHTPIHLWVLSDGRRVDIPVAEDGILKLGPHPDWVERGLVVQSDQTPGTLSIMVDLQIRRPVDGAIQVSYLQDALVQAQNAIKVGARRMGGFLASLAAPSVNGVAVKLAGCCTGVVTLHAPSGDVAFKQSAAGEVHMSKAKLAEAAGGNLSASAPIETIAPDAD